MKKKPTTTKEKKKEKKKKGKKKKKKKKKKKRWREATVVRVISTVRTTKKTKKTEGDGLLSGPRKKFDYVWVDLTTDPTYEVCVLGDFVNKYTHPIGLAQCTEDEKSDGTVEVAWFGPSGWKGKVVSAKNSQFGMFWQNTKEAVRAKNRVKIASILP
jgi:hypothetical protein